MKIEIEDGMNCWPCPSERWDNGKKKITIYFDFKAITDTRKVVYCLSTRIFEF